MPKDSLDYKIVIVDEVSMVNQRFIDLLLSHDVYVIFTGDPGQLPTVSDDRNHLLDNPHIFLDEIQRQAAESDIIKLSMLIREGRPIYNFKGKDAMVLPKDSLNTGMLEWADEIICSTNATRVAINSQVRQLKGYEKPIEEGEKIICLTNEWNTFSDKENALTNGVIGTLSNIIESSLYLPKYIDSIQKPIELVRGDFISETGDNFGRLTMDKYCILCGKPYLDGSQKYKMRKAKKYSDSIPYEFTYSYAITCHKAQGSSWSKILILEENFPFSREEHKRWLYTAVTRSEDRCVLITKD